MQQELPPAVSVQPLSASSLCARPLAAVRAELWGSGSGPFLPSMQSFLVALKVKKKKRKEKKTNSSGAQRREQSRGTRGECSSVLFFIGKAGFQESGNDGEEEQNLCEGTSWAVFLLVGLLRWCVWMSTCAF